MVLLIAFLIFAISMVLAIIKGFSMVLALLVGLAAFLVAVRCKGFAFGGMLTESRKSIKESLVVIEVMLIIGLITATWRVSGTIIIFVYYGMKLIMPPLFLLIAFALTFVCGVRQEITGLYITNCFRMSWSDLPRKMYRLRGFELFQKENRKWYF